MLFYGFFKVYYIDGKWFRMKFQLGRVDGDRHVWISISCFNIF